MSSINKKAHTLQATLAPGGYLYYNLDADMSVIRKDNGRYIRIAKIPVVPPFVMQTRNYLEWNY